MNAKILPFFNKITYLTTTILLVLGVAGCSKKVAIPGNGVYNLETWQPDKKGNQSSHLAFQNAIDFVSKQGGGTILVPKGRYLIPGTHGKRIICRSYVNLQFEAGCQLFTGFQKEKSWVIDFNTLHANCQQIKIEGNGLIIEGNRNMPKTGMGIAFNKHLPEHRLSDIRISGIRLRNFSNTAVNIGGGEGLLGKTLQAVVFSAEAKLLNVRVNTPDAFRAFVNTPKLVKLKDRFFTVEAIDGQTLQLRHRKTNNTTTPEKIAAYSTITANGYPENIYFEEVVCENNKINGLSITHANQVHFVNCTFRGTEGGGDPEAGVDIEPNIDQSVFNVSFENCEFIDNRQNGLYIHKGLGVASETGRIKNCVFKGNGEYGCAISEKHWVIEQSVASANKLDGFLISDGNSRIDSCEASGNGKSGFIIVRGRVDVSRSRSFDNTRSGFLFSELEAGSLSNSYSRNNHFGLAVVRVAQMKFADNHVSDNRQDGIRISDHSSNNRFVGNRVCNNGREGKSRFAEISIESGASYNEFQDNVFCDSAGNVERSESRAKASISGGAEPNFHYFIQSSDCKENLIDSPKAIPGKVKDNGSKTKWLKNTGPDN